MKRLLSALAMIAALALPIAAEAQVPSLQNFRNLLVGGDVGADAFQGGTANVTGINTTGTYFADNFYAFANNAGASVTLSRQNAAPDISTGYRAAVRVQRAAANANLAPIVYGQPIESGLAIQLQGQTLVMSAVCQLGANFSGTGLTLQLVTGTSADEGLATRISGLTGAVTQASSTFVLPATGFARFGHGSQSAVISGSGVATTAYAVASFVVAANVQEAYAEITYTPVGTAGTNDWFECEHIQLEAVPTNPSGVPLQATAPERRPMGVELALAERYVYVMTDGAATLRYGCSGAASSTSVIRFSCPLPVKMRVAPSVTVSTATSFGATLATGAVAEVCNTMANVATTSTVNGFALSCTTTAAPYTAGQASEMIGGATTGTITMSARL